MQNLSLTASEHKDYQGHFIPDQKNPLVHQAKISFGTPQFLPDFTSGSQYFMIFLCSIENS